MDITGLMKCDLNAGADGRTAGRMWKRSQNVTWLVEVEAAKYCKEHRDRLALAGVDDGGQVPIGDVMRCLMYCRSYGDRHRAISSFRDIPQNVRSKIADLDYSLAEKRCPQKMAIGNLMRNALKELA